METTRVYGELLDQSESPIRTRSHDEDVNQVVDWSSC